MKPKDLQNETWNLTFEPHQKCSRIWSKMEPKRAPKWDLKSHLEGWDKVPKDHSWPGPSKSTILDPKSFPNDTILDPKAPKMKQKITTIITEKVSRNWRDNQFSQWFVMFCFWHFTLLFTGLTAQFTSQHSLAHSTADSAAQLTGQHATQVSSQHTSPHRTAQLTARLNVTVC